MTVGELMTRLSDCDPEQSVVVWECDDGTTFYREPVCRVGTLNAIEHVETDALGRLTACGHQGREYIAADKCSHCRAVPTVGVNVVIL